MVTSKDPLVTTVPSSITLQVTVVVPSGNRAVTVMVPCPDVPPGPSHVRPTGLPTLFAALAEYVTLAPVASVASATIVPGKVRTGSAAAAEPTPTTKAPETSAIPIDRRARSFSNPNGGQPRPRNMLGPQRRRNLEGSRLAPPLEHSRGEVVGPLFLLQNGEVQSDEGHPHAVWG